MLATVIVRPRADEDLAGCVRVLEAVHQSDGYPTWWPSDPAGWLSPSGFAAAWVAEDDEAGAVLGHVCVVRGVDDPMVAALAGVSTERLAGVSRLFVAPAARGRGLRLGARLLAAVSAWSGEQDLHLMLDVVDDGAPAVALYERLGWRLVDQREAGWLTPGGKRLPVRAYLAPRTGRVPPVQIVQLDPTALRALADGDLQTANASSPVPMSAYCAGADWRGVWRMRSAQVQADPESASWITGVIWDVQRGLAVGRAGFHGPPDAAGMVEVGYAVDPAHRRQGYARAALEALLGRAAREPGVSTVRATIRPDNAASRALVLQYGLTEVGEQWDDEDGLETVFEVDSDLFP